MFEEITRYTLAVGLNDKDTETQLIKKEDAIATIQSIVGDSTIQEVNGVYKGKPETSLKVELLFKSVDDVLNYCEAIKKELNQESIAVVKDTVISALI